MIWDITGREIASSTARLNLDVHGASPQIHNRTEEKRTEQNRCAHSAEKCRGEARVCAAPAEARLACANMSLAIILYFEIVMSERARAVEGAPRWNNCQLPTKQPTTDQLVAFPAGALPSLLTCGCCRKLLAPLASPASSALSAQSGCMLESYQQSRSQL